MIKTIGAMLFSCLLWVSSSTIAMECSDPIDILPAEVINLIAQYLDPKDTCRCIQISQKWNKLLTDEKLWQFYCYKFYRVPTSRSTNLKFIEFFRQLSLDRVQGAIIAFPTIGKYCDDIILKEKTITNSMSRSEHQKIFQELLEESPNQKTIVIYSHACFKLANLNHFENLCHIALKKDILLIFPGGNSPETIVEDNYNGSSVHDIFPNIIWVGGHDGNGAVHQLSSRGGLIEIYAHFYGGTSFSAIICAEVATNIRLLRRDLTAEETKLILLESAIESNGIKILNEKNARTLALEFEPNTN